MTDDTEPTKEELEQRVDQLEATVAKMLPNRRQALAGMGAAASGALLWGTATGSTGSAGTIGTDSDRPDVFADEIDSNLVSTDEVFITNKSRISSSSNQEITDSPTEVVWDQSARDETGLVDLSNNGFTMDADVERVRLTAGFQFANAVDLGRYEIRKNGSAFDGVDQHRSVTIQSGTIRSAWVDVSDGDTFTIRSFLQSGSTAEDLVTAFHTWFELEAEVQP